MARRFRRLHRMREEVVKITRRLFRFCCICGTVEEEVKTDIVPVRKVFSGNLGKAEFSAPGCEHDKTSGDELETTTDKDTSTCSGVSHEQSETTADNGMGSRVSGEQSDKTADNGMSSSVSGEQSETRTDNGVASKVGGEQPQPTADKGETSKVTAEKFCSEDVGPKTFNSAPSSDLSLSDFPVVGGPRNSLGSEEAKQCEYQIEYYNDDVWPTQYLVSGWKAHRILSSGTFGIVKLVSFSDPPETFVLEVRLAQESEREVTALAHCQSRFVAELCASVVHSQKRLMFLRNYQHGDLARWMARDKNRTVFNEGIAVWTAANLYAGVDYLHRKGIMHLNITPGNVLIDVYGYPILGGFRNARKLDDSAERLQKHELNIAYASPEMLGIRPPDKMADLWAVACCLYEIIKGRSPFLGRTNAETEMRVFLGCVRDMYGLSYAAFKFISSELHLHRSRRFGFHGGITCIMRQRLFRHIDWSEFQSERRPGESPLLAILPCLPELKRPSTKHREPSKILAALQNEISSSEESDRGRRKVPPRKQRRRRRPKRERTRRRGGRVVNKNGYLASDEDSGEDD
ncbi:serine/threonine-protein kinase Nek3-like [Liolophura sinensis]|uniref:serine/threonine-protein kinase Nek3-like n=1 Tax=Liolophura sinensis TaxID=3198878 RepID=UPI003158A507